MSLGLGIILVDGLFGTIFAPGGEVFQLCCLSDRSDIMSDYQAPLSEPDLAAAFDLLRQIIPDE